MLRCDPDMGDVTPIWAQRNNYEKVDTRMKRQVSFRGFCGAYVITVKMPDGRAGQWEAVILNGCENQRVFTVE